MSRRLIFSGRVPADVNNRFTPGSGVGGSSRAVRRALVRRAANSTCCQPGGGDSGGHGAPGGGHEIGNNLDVGFWIESSNSALGKLQAIFGAQKGADGTTPGLNIKILVIRMNGYDRFNETPPSNTQVNIKLKTANGNFYEDSSVSDSFANWVTSNPEILNSVEQIWILPYQDKNTGFAESKYPSTPPTPYAPATQYMNDLWVAANFTKYWKTLLPSGIASKVNGIVFELEHTTIVKPDSGYSFTQAAGYLNVSLNGKANTSKGQRNDPDPTLIKNYELKNSRQWSATGLEWAITGGPSTGNPGAWEKIHGGPSGFCDDQTPNFCPTIVYHQRSYSRYFPQIYNVGNLIVPVSQSLTNQKFWNETSEAWQKDSSYSRMFSLEAQDAALEKWGKGAFLAIPSLANVIQYIRQQGGLGTSILYMPPDFDYSAPLIG